MHILITTKLAILKRQYEHNKPMLILLIESKVSALASAMNKDPDWVLATVEVWKKCMEDNYTHLERSIQLNQPLVRSFDHQGNPLEFKIAEAVPTTISNTEYLLSFNPDLLKKLNVVDYSLL